jgi:hypothetical protein
MLASHGLALNAGVCLESNDFTKLTEKTVAVLKSVSPSEIPSSPVSSLGLIFHASHPLWQQDKTRTQAIPFEWIHCVGFDWFR